mmetsp:Transcript_88727/g.253594  ORF Transcript_88727/g.253594 Transcript_88727/m.253594 type:complete len:308 (+) Transcript_88727:236-1159(+)
MDLHSQGQALLAQGLNAQAEACQWARQRLHRGPAAVRAQAEAGGPPTAGGGEAAAATTVLLGNYHVSPGRGASLERRRVVGVVAFAAGRRERCGLHRRGRGGRERGCETYVVIDARHGLARVVPGGQWRLGCARRMGYARGSHSVVRGFLLPPAAPPKAPSATEAIAEATTKGDAGCEGAASQGERRQTVAACRRGTAKVGCFPASQREVFGRRRERRRGGRWEAGRRRPWHVLIPRGLAPPLRRHRSGRGSEEERAEGPHAAIGDGLSAPPRFGHGGVQRVVLHRRLRWAGRPAPPRTRNFCKRSR